MRSLKQKFLQIDGPTWVVAAVLYGAWLLMIFAVWLVNGSASTTKSEFRSNADSPFGPLKTLTPFTRLGFLE